MVTVSRPEDALTDTHKHKLLTLVFSGSICFQHAIGMIFKWYQKKHDLDLMSMVCVPSIWIACKTQI